MSNGLYDLMYTTLRQLLIAGKEPKEVEKQIPAIHLSFKNFYPDQNVDYEQLFRELMCDFNVWVGNATFLDDNRDHQEWLQDEKATINWAFWKRYKEFLLKLEKFAPDVVEKIDSSTDEILRRLESPKRKGHWDRRGMVVGSVQSGKTSNYIGLIAKAVDAGYKMIIVLAGLNNDLRSQTQKRIDKGFLGIDTIKSKDQDQSSIQIGAGLLFDFKVPHVHPITSSKTSGDFKNSVHQTLTILPGGDPIVAVVKKNVTPLSNLLEAFSHINKSGQINDVPLLIIDDEADNASIDTKVANKIENEDAPEQDPTRINGLIRKILNCFTQSAYVGYTATPFANIFIYPGNEKKLSPSWGEDLFPRSFIVNLKAPSNHLGPERVFGLSPEKDSGLQTQSPLPLVREISDFSKAFPEGHKKSLRVSLLPASLIEAIHTFILSSAVRFVRGQNHKHHSMLVHVTRFNDVQSQITELIKQYVGKVSNQLEMRTGPQYINLIDELEKIWNRDFIPTSQKVKSEFEAELNTNISWIEIEKVLFKVVSKIEVKSVNGKVADGGLNYDDYLKGCSVIAVGGDKLSRGLTLEGLMVSYYTRTSKMYDTLMQMGRWFGYRKGYSDVCRLFTTKKLIKAFKHITFATAELRQMLDNMAEMNATPETYGLRVRTDPEGVLLVTAKNKMKNSKEIAVTFAGKLLQVSRFYKRDKCNEDNLLELGNWVSSLGKPTQDAKAFGEHLVWNNVSPVQVCDLLKKIRIHNSCSAMDPNVVGEYILAQTDQKELTNWTVVLVSKESGRKVNVGNFEIGKSWRTDISDEDDDTVYLRSNHLITENHESLDLTEEEKELAYKRTLEHFEPSKRSPLPPKDPSPVWIRRTRKMSNGLLLIYIFDSGESESAPRDIPYVGYALSFPDSENAKKVTYKVDKVFLDNELDFGK